MKIRIGVVMAAVFLTSAVWVLGNEAKVAASPVTTLKSTEKGKWITSFDEAKEQAGKRKVPILVDFSGSDWCGWCIKLDKEVFSKTAFTDYASGNLVLLMVDFPRKKHQDIALKQQNDKLASQFGIEGFPTVLLLDSDGKVLARTGYRPGGAEAYVKHLQALLQIK